MNQMTAALAFPDAERGRRWHSDASVFDRIGKPGARELAHIPGKKGLPLLGILPEAVLDPIGFAQRMHARHGRVYRFYACGSWNVQIIGPEANELVLFDRDSGFSAWGGWSPVIEPFFPGALLIQDGERHRANRRILGEAFRQQKLASYQALLDAEIARTVNSWIGRTIDVYDEVKRLTLRIAASTFLGIEIGGRTDAAMKAFARMMTALTALGHNRWLSPVAARGYQGKAFLEAFILDLIAEKRADPGDDILSRICHLEDEGGAGLSDDEIRNSIIFLLAAAHDTMASGLTSTLYYLGRGRWWQDCIRAEIEGAGLAQPVDAALADLPLQDMSFKEALRLNATAPVIWRRATRPYSIYGYDLPAGTITGVSPMLVHLDPEIWHDPLDFNPHRFTPEAEALRHKHAFVPFGGGVHKCLGLHFSQQQARIFMTRLFSKAELRIVNPDAARWYHWPNCRPRGRLEAKVTAIPARR
jgi:cytochrome P450